MNKNNDNMTMGFMIRESVYVLNGVFAEYVKELSEYPELLQKLTTTKQAAKELKWGYGVWIPKIIAPYALKGILDATEAIREELEKIRKEKQIRSKRATRLKHAIWRLIRWIMDKLLPTP